MNTDERLETIARKNIGTVGDDLGGKETEDQLVRVILVPLGEAWAAAMDESSMILDAVRLDLRVADSNNDDLKQRIIELEAENNQLKSDILGSGGPC